MVETPGLVCSVFQVVGGVFRVWRREEIIISNTRRAKDVKFQFWNGSEFFSYPASLFFLAADITDPEIEATGEVLWSADLEVDLVEIEFF